VGSVGVALNPPHANDDLLAVGCRVERLEHGLGADERGGGDRG
jgi:hypothetical protein